MTKKEGKRSKEERANNGQEAFKSFKSLPIQGRFYLVTVYILGVVIYAVHLPSLDSKKLLSAITLGILSGIVGCKKVVDLQGRARFTAETVVQGIAYLTGGMPTLLFSYIISILIQSVVSKKAWYVWTFNLLQLPIQFFLLETSLGWLNRVIPLQSSYNIPALLISFAFSSTAHIALVTTVFFLVDGIPITKSNAFTVMTVVRETCFFCVALSTIMIWEIEPLAILVTLSPVYMLYSSFHLHSLKAKSEMDQKTGLLNAETFIGALEDELERAKRYNRPLALVMADLDYLRHVNNTYGHLVGDRVLVEVGQALKDVFRDFDTVARFGGEEFAVLLPETTHENVVSVVERARQRIQDLSITTETSDKPIRITMSFGIAHRDRAVRTVRDLIHNADMALYHAKGSGRNCIGIWKDSKVLCVTMPFSIPIEHVLDR
jgi:diguanylate cyclase (GGDEF)-like protein